MADHKPTGETVTTLVPTPGPVVTKSPPNWGVGNGITPAETAEVHRNAPSERYRKPWTQGDPINPDASGT